MNYQHQGRNSRQTHEKPTDPGVAIAWTGYASFGPGDFGLPDNCSTQVLPQSPSLNLSHDSYSSCGNGGHFTQWSNSRTSDATAGYNNLSSLLDEVNPSILHHQYNTNYSTASAFDPNWPSSSDTLAFSDQYGLDWTQATPRSADQFQYSHTMGDLPSPSSTQVSSRTEKYHCRHPGCEADAFSRSADLARHVKHVHGSKENLEKWYCDYKTCVRSERYVRDAEAAAAADHSPSPGGAVSQGYGAFTRKDHYKAHLREFHKEALPKRNTKDDPNWMDGKTIKEDWWRCLKCLKRVWIKKSGSTCWNCKSSMDKDVKDVRQRKLKSEHSRSRHH